MLGSLFLSLLFLLAPPTQAQTTKPGSRAGSNFSVAQHRIGRISKRPYLRRQKTVSKASAVSEPKFDYRLELAEASRSEEDELDYLEQANFEQAGYCDCVGGCSCGTGLERGCGCSDSCGLGGCDGGCEPGCGCEDSFEPSCGCDDSGCATGCDVYGDPSCGCNEGGCSVYGSCDGGCDSCSGGYRSFGRGSGGTWKLGFEWSFVKPRFSENVAFNTMSGNGNNVSTFTDTEFDYDLELTPRVWLEAGVNDSWSWRLGYWQYDHSPGTKSTSPNANGFGEITHPAFGDVDISTTIPTDTFFASSKLNAYTIDLEALKQGQLCGWQLGVGGGLRYASVEQDYFARLTDNETGNDLRGQIDFSHALEGFGPTMSLSARRPLIGSLTLACAARGSLLFGDGSSRMIAGEDLDLANPFLTTRTTDREDLLPIGEARVGIEWLSPKKHSRSWQWMLSTAMEGQVWGNAGNASSETADLGFFGFNFGAGFLR